MVTNGGYGGVQQALAHGVPLVVAGDSEDKPEVAARVRWSGVGIDLRRGDPSPAQLATAYGFTGFYHSGDEGQGQEADARRDAQARRPLAGHAAPPSGRPARIRAFCRPIQARSRSKMA